MENALEIMHDDGDKQSGGAGGFTFQNIFNKIREQLTRSDQPKFQDYNKDWEIPFDRIRLSHNEFQRCGSQGLVSYGKLSNSPVAVKRIKSLSPNKDLHLKDLSHKNVIKFFGVSSFANYHYIIMEWCPYDTLHNFIHSGRQLSAKILCDFSQQIANGVKYLHSNHIIHRDLKPSNILLTHNDIIKISDFGTHKVLKRNELSMTTTGTYAYMAPEVIRGEPHSFPVDVWSYGVVLWELLTGKRPYENLDTTAIIYAIGNNSYRLPVPNTFHKGFKCILDGCWKENPDERLRFSQICMILIGAVQEISKMPKQQWLPLQAQWRMEINHSNLKNDPREEQISRWEEEARERLEQSQRMSKENSDMHLRLQETCMLLQQERQQFYQQLAEEKRALAARETRVKERELELDRRESAVSKREAEVLKKETTMQ